MRLTCPHCGERDRREFTYQGADEILHRPEAGADAEAWHAYVHLRDNPAGDTRDMWYHDPCGAWIVVHRNTITHAVARSELAAEAKR
jgi:sarcosine oxidase subunit delta